MSTVVSTWTAEGSSVLVILEGHGHRWLLNLQGCLIISGVKSWNFSCLPEWHEIKSQEKAMKPSYMLLLAYVQRIRSGGLNRH